MWFWIVASLHAEAKKPRPPFVCSPGYSNSLPMPRTSMRYESGRQLDEEEKKRAANELREPVPMPIQGMLTFTVERASIDQASGDNHVFVVESAGKQIVRYEPERTVPRPGTGPMWWDTFVVLLPDETEWPVTVHAADKFRVYRCTWTVSWEGVVRWVAPN